MGLGLHPTSDCAPTTAGAQRAGARHYRRRPCPCPPFPPLQLRQQPGSECPLRDIYTTSSCDLQRQKEALGRTRQGTNPSVRNLRATRNGRQIPRSGAVPARLRRAVCPCLSIDLHGRSSMPRLASLVDEQTMRSQVTSYASFGTILDAKNAPVDRAWGGSSGA